MRRSVNTMKILIIIVIIAIIAVLLIIWLKIPVTVKASNGDVFEFSTVNLKWSEVEATKKQYDIGEGLVYEHVAAFTDGKKVIRCAVINYYPSQIPQSQLSAARQALAYLFTEAGETYEGAVSEDTESKLNEYFTNYMNTYLTAPDPEEVGQIKIVGQTETKTLPLYKYTVHASAEDVTYFEMYYCLYSDNKILAFFVNSGRELSDITADGLVSDMDTALADQEIMNMLSQENIEAAIASESMFKIYMDNLIVKLGGLPSLSDKDFTDDTTGSVLEFAKRVRIKDNGNELVLTDQ